MQLLYYLLNICSYLELFSKFVSWTESIFMFFFKWQFCFKTCHTTQCLKAHSNLFWLVSSPRIEQQQLNFTNCSVNLTVAAAFLYTISDARSKKKKNLGLAFKPKRSSKKVNNLFLIFSTGNASKLWPNLPPKSIDYDQQQ